MSLPAVVLQNVIVLYSLCNSNLLCNWERISQELVRDISQLFTVV
jgi:hypothetical protein